MRTFALLLLLLLLPSVAWSHATERGVPFANMIDLAEPPYNAKEDAVTDDTAALQAALAANSRATFVIKGDTVILGANGAHGVVTMLPTQALVCVGGARIVTGTGSANPFQWNDQLGGWNQAGENPAHPNVSGCQFMPALTANGGTANGYYPGTTAMVIGGPNLVFENAGYVWYDTPISFINDAYIMTLFHVGWANNKIGLLAPASAANSFSTMDCWDCQFASNINDIEIHESVGASDWNFYGGVHATPVYTGAGTGMYIADLTGTNNGGDMDCHVKMIGVHFETTAAASGNGATGRIKNTNCALEMIDPYFVESDDGMNANNGSMFFDGLGQACTTKLINPFFAIANYGPAALVGQNGCVYTVTGAKRRFGDAEVRMYPQLSGFVNSDFETGTMAGWSVIAGSGSVINTDHNFGTHSLSVSGAGGVVEAADNILVPPAIHLVQIGFFAKNTDAVNANSAQALSAPIKGGALSSISGASVNIPANSGWTHYKIQITPPPNGMQLNIALVSSSGGNAILYDDFYYVQWRRREKRRSAPSNDNRPTARDRHGRPLRRAA